MSGARDYLFVYGTLLSGDGGPTGTAQRARLAREARVIGTGSVEGRLYDLGRYPGLGVPAHGETVHGEVLELPGAERTLRWLDVYEGIVPGRHCHNVSGLAPERPNKVEYEREQRDVTLDDGRTVRAWVYMYRGALTDAKLIADGRWLRT